MIDPGPGPAPRPPLARDEELGPVGRTLLITLWARAEESRAPDGLRSDPDAERLVDRIDHDFSRYRRGWKTRIGVAVRGHRIDEAIRSFGREHPDGLIIELGAGLDGRSRRLGGPGHDWLLVDLPDVMRVRRRLLRPVPREHLHDGSLTDPAWIDVARRLGDRPRLIVAEGVLMFVERASVARTLGQVAERLPGARLLADVIGPMMVRHPWLHDTLPRNGARFTWGLARNEDPADWHPGIRVRARHPLLLDGGRRWRWMRLLRPLPVMRRQFLLLDLDLGTPRSASTSDHALTGSRS